MPPPTTHSWLRYRAELWPQRGGGGVPEVSNRLQRGRQGGWVGGAQGTGRQEDAAVPKGIVPFHSGAMQPPAFSTGQQSDRCKQTDAHLNFQVSTSSTAREPPTSLPPIPPKKKICRAAGSKDQGIRASLMLTAATPAH